MTLLGVGLFATGTSILAHEDISSIFNNKFRGFNGFLGEYSAPCKSKMRAHSLCFFYFEFSYSLSEVIYTIAINIIILFSNNIQEYKSIYEERTYQLLAIQQNKKKKKTFLPSTASMGLSSKKDLSLK